MLKSWAGYVFKIIAKGISGDDGNLYRYFLSTEKNSNIPVEGGNAFTYEYTFRLSNNQNNVSQIYPYLDDKVISVEDYTLITTGMMTVLSGSFLLPREACCVRFPTTRTGKPPNCL